MEHAKRGASNCHRWANCPGCLRQIGDRQSPQNEFSLKGTAEHFVAEHCLISGKDTSQLEGHAAFPQHKKHLANDSFDMVQVYLDVIRADYEAMKEDGEPEMWVEEKLILNWLYPGMFGTSDCLAGVKKKRLVVYDYKSGYGGFHIEQPKYYGLAALGEKNLCGYKEVDLVVSQPRISRYPDTLVMKTKDLYEWGYDFLLPAAKATDDPEAPLVPGDHCKYCPGAIDCQALLDEIGKAAEMDFSLPAVQGQTLPDITELPLDRLIRLSDLGSMFLNYFKDIDKLLFEKAESGVIIPGRKLVKKRSNRVWKDAEAAEKAVFGLVNRSKCIYTQNFKTVAQIEKLDKQLKEAIKDLWEKPETGNTLAPLSDKRPAVVPTAELDFVEETDMFKDMFG